MANTTGQGTIYNLPNYAGMLFTSDMMNTPFLSMIGGISGGQETTNAEFVIDSEYSMPAASQPAISELASLTAPTAIGYVRGQNTNVTQIFHEKVSLSYEKLSNPGRLSGLNTAGAQNNAPNELDFQISKALAKISRDIEYTIINGVYVAKTASNAAEKTRGMINLCSTGNTIAAAGASLSKALIDTLLRTMFANGAQFNNMVFWVNAFQKQALSNIYGYAPMDRNVGGINIKQIETDFGNIGIALDRFMPTDTLLLSDMAVISPVFQPVPGKGNFFYETLSKVGASEDGQIYGKFGLNHGPQVLHGTITGLATA